MENYYQPDIETASRDQMTALQNKRLVDTVKRVYENVEYYRKKMQETGVEPGDIRGVEDLHKLPFLTKDDLRECYPYGLMARPVRDSVRIQSTSGTTGRRVVAFYTQHDIDVWEDCCARAITAAGGTDEDVCLVFLTTSNEHQAQAIHLHVYDYINKDEGFKSKSYSTD